MDATEPVVLEIERFEWVKPDRLELVGTWSGVGARRFIRPTLILERDGEPMRLLAVLEHKPWHPTDGAEWIAAFAWDGEPVKFDSADMNVAPGIDVKLPPPRMRPGKPRRFKQRAVARDATREALAVDGAPGPGIVSELPKAAAPKPEPETAAPEPKAAAPEPKTVDQKPRTDPERTVRLETVAAADPPPAESRAEKSASADDTAVESSEVVRLRADVERLRGELDRARSDRDQAREETRAARLAIEEERQARERAIADARADERGKANTSLAEGAELRAAIERQRQLAYEARDEAVKQRDSAVAAREQACSERDDAVAQRKQAERDRSAADSERDRALKEAEKARAARDKALAERADALRERDEANKERDTIVSLHDRGLPVVPPKPRFGPPEEGPQTDLDVWGPRVAALIVLLIFAVIVLHLFSSF